MRVSADQLLIAPTDLSAYVACRHRTGLDLAVASGALHRPRDDDPYAAILRKKGAEHEARYIESLRARGLEVVSIRREEGPAAAGALARQADETLAAMRMGAEVVVQARLAHGSMAGYADVLIRVDTASRLGPWSYEAQDTKLARETRGGAILQLCGYSELLAHLQGLPPAHFHVVTPDSGQPIHSYRTADYMAYYRTVRASLDTAVAGGHERLRSEHYPEPVEHCAICAWEAHCVRRRRQDDHLSFIANAGRRHRHELAAQGYPTLSAAASMPVPVVFTPSRGAREAYDRLGEQARLQHRQRVETASSVRVPAGAGRRGVVPAARAVTGRRVPGSRGRPLCQGGRPRVPLRRLHPRRLPRMVGHGRWRGEARLRGGHGPHPVRRGGPMPACTCITSITTSRRRSRSWSAGT